jgi:hydroxymethylglutaryl-CoA reductase
MNLHAKNVAISAGIPSDLVTDAVEFMKSRNRINGKTALYYLQGHEQFKMH